MSCFVTLMLYVLSCFIIHSVICNLVSQGTTLVKFLIVGTLIGLMLIINLYHTHGLQIETISMVLLYAFACELYIFIFTFIASSVSVSILLKILEGHTDIDMLAHKYCGNIMVEDRLRRMKSVGLLHIIDNMFYLTPKGSILISRFNMLHKLFFTI